MKEEGVGCSCVHLPLGLAPKSTIVIKAIRLHIDLDSAMNGITGRHRLLLIKPGQVSNYLYSHDMFILAAVASGMLTEHFN